MVTSCQQHLRGSVLLVLATTLATLSVCTLIPAYGVADDGYGTAAVLDTTAYLDRALPNTVDGNLLLNYVCSNKSVMSV